MALNHHKGDEGDEGHKGSPIILTLTPVVLLPEITAEVAAVRFQPNGAFALLGVPQHRLQDPIVDATALEIRFTNAAARVTVDPSARLADVSSDAGYFDQSDMIRNFLSFAAALPNSFVCGSASSRG